MNTNPLVSVIIPTYNRANLLSAAIDSVLQQTYRSVEIVVIDDGSTDETPALLGSYGDRIRTVRQQNGGPARARNHGIRLSRGEIVTFLDSDDRWLPSKLERQVQSLNVAGPEVVCSFCNCTVHYADGRMTTTFALADIKLECEAGIWTNPAEVLANRFVLFNQVVAVRREVLNRVGLFDESLKYLEDYDLSFRLALEGPWAILREELATYFESTPGSLARQARSEEVRMREDLVQVRTRMSELARQSGANPKLPRLTARELRREKRELSIAHLRQRTSLGAFPVAKVWSFGERMRRAIYRRSVGYPRTMVKELEFS